MANDPNLNPSGDGETIGVEEASAGQKTGHMRWVLAIGTVVALLGVVLALVMVSP